MNVNPAMLLRYAMLATGIFFAGPYLQFDGFGSVILALSGIFIALFASTLHRYQRRVGVGKAGEHAVQQMLSNLGIEAVHDVYLPQPGGSMQLDHIALFPASLAVIETKTYNGCFDMDSTRHWHRIGRRGPHLRISNPLWQLEAAKKALSAAIPGVSVWGLVVLAGNYTTTGSHPSNVVSIEGLRNYIADHRRRHGEWHHTEQINEAWKQLNALKREYAPLSKTHVRNARKKRGDRFYDFEEVWPLWLWGSLAVEAVIFSLLLRYDLI